MTFFWLVLLLLFPGQALAQITDLTEAEKVQKRLQFNAYVEEELARAAAVSAEQKPVKKTRWFVDIEPSFTYDSNANLDSDKQSDSYRELRAELGFKSERPDWGLLKGGRWGISAFTDIVDYHKFSALDYTDSELKAFASSNLSETVTLKADYAFEIVNYPESDQLNYFNNKIRPELFQQISKRFGHYVYGLMQFKNYPDRKALTETNSAGEDYRSDETYEPGYGLRILLGDDTYLGLSGAWQKNDSTDLFDDFNDYHGYKTGGFAYRQLFRRAAMVFVGGYDFKQYDERDFRTGSDEAERDHFYYLGTYVYFDLSSKTQISLSYLYKQNNSNDPSQEYSGYLVSLGLNVAL